MKRLGLLAFTVLIAISIFGIFTTSKVLAQTPEEIITDTVPVEFEAGAAASGMAIPPGAAPPSATPPKTTQTPETLDDGTCGIFGKASITNCISSGVSYIIKKTFLNIAGFFLWLSGNMFNFAIKAGVLQFSDWATPALYPMWMMVRQIISLFVVFVGLYLGFLYIIGKDGFQRYVPWVIMFALFVNFSYPLVRTAIDISNIVSLNIYASVVGSDALAQNADATGGGLIVSKLGLQGLVASASRSEESTLLKSINTVPAALLAVCYVFYASYIFFMVTMLFVIRTAALVFLIVASPLLLVDSVLPMLGDKAKKLREIFFAQLAVGPIFMIMFALTVRFLDVFGAAGGPLKTTQLGTVTTGDQTVSTFFNILMMLVLMWIMLKVTKIASGSVGEFMTNAVGTVGSFTVGAATGGIAAGTGLLARKGIGGLAAKVRDSKWISNRPDSFVAQRAYTLSNAVASSTFDVRNTAVAQKYAGKLGISGGMGAGTKFGFDEENKKRVEAVAARGARIKTKYERDVIKDGKVVARKGDTDKEGVQVLERFHQNNGGALFLTKKQKEDLASTFVEDTGNKTLSEYKKQPNKTQKQAFVASLNKDLEDLQKAGQGTSPKAQALMRTIYDIGEQEKEEKRAFDLQLEKEIDKYKATSDAKKQDYLARLDKDMREAVINATTTTQETSSTPVVSQQVPLTGQALRQARIETVATGRANNVAVAQKNISLDKEDLEKFQEIKRQVMENYEKELTAIMANELETGLVDARGNKILSNATQAKIDVLNRKRDANIQNLNSRMQGAADDLKEDTSELSESIEKQKESAKNAAVFAENRNQGSSTTSPSAPEVAKEDFTAHFAKKRAAARAAVDVSFKKNESLTTSRGSGGVDTTKPAANQTPFTAQATA